MIFERLEVEDVGALGDVELVFSPGLNVLFGDNESGKTTLAEAIFGALYGSRDTSGARARARREVERLAPWEGGAFRVSLDLLLAGGEKLAVTRRLGETKGDLTVFDTALSADVTEAVTGGKDLGEALLGVPAGLYRDSFFIPQMALAPSSGAGAMEKIANLQDTGREDTSYVEAVKTLEAALTRLGKSDAGGATLVGRARAQLDELTERLQEAAARRGALFEAEGRLEELRLALAEGEDTLAALTARLAGAQRREASERLAAIARATRRQAEVRQRLEEVAPMAEIDPHHRRYVRVQLEQVLFDLDSRRQDLDRFGEEIQGAPGHSRLPGEDWVERSSAILESLSVAQAAAHDGLGWGVFAAVGLLAVALAGTFLLKEGLLPLALLLPAIVLAVFGRRATPKKLRAEIHELEVRKIAAAAEASIPDLTPEAIAEVAERLEASLHDRETLLRRNELRFDIERLEERRDELQQEIESWQSQADEEMIDSARKEIVELRQEETELLLELDRLHSLPVAEIEARAAADAAPDDADPALLEREIQSLRLTVHGQRERLGQLEEEVMGRLAEIGDLVAIGREREAAAAEFERLRARRQAILFAAEKLQAASEDYRRRIAPPLASGVGVWLKALTAGRYETATVDEGIRPRVQAADGAYHPPEDLSQGARDLVYLALHLALIEQLPGDVAPIVLDDPCVNMDRSRTRRVMAALKALAEQRQVLYLTCHEREAELAAVAGARVLKAPWTDEEEARA